MSSQTSDHLPVGKTTRPVKPAKTSKGISAPGTDPQIGPVSSFQKLQKLAGNRAVQRLVQRTPVGSNAPINNTTPFELDDEIASQIEKARLGGQPMDTSARSTLEPSLGYDLSTVKIHNSPEDSQLSQAVGAKAFTLGSDVFFKEGAYNPQSSDGQQLLAHELTHVIQQNEGNVGSSARMSVNAPGDSHEQEADKTAREITAQQKAASQTNAQAVGQVQRKEEEI